MAKNARKIKEFNGETRNVGGDMLWFLPLRSWLCLLAIFPLCACSVLNSSSLELTDSGNTDAGVEVSNDPFKCASSAGSYTLSRTMLTASITFVGEAERARGPTFNGLGVSSAGDPDHHYCLDFAISPTAQETVRIKKTNSGLLETVTGNIRDQSRFILEAIAETIFIAISGSPTASVRSQSAQEGKTEVKFIYEFDPFDFEDTARFNDRANDFGFCVLIPHYSFNSEKHSIDDYCNDPLWSLAEHKPSWHKAAAAKQLANIRHDRTSPTFTPVTDPALLHGLLYRPKFPYRVYLMNKVSGHWIIKARRQILMENISPILSVGIERAFFARRTTALVFRNGVLEGACVYNSAGITEFVQVPIAVARGLVRLPTEILSVRLGDARGNTALAQVERRVLQAQQQQLDLLINTEQTEVAGVGNNTTLVSDSTRPRLEAQGISRLPGGGLTNFASDDFLQSQAAFVTNDGQVDQAKCPLAPDPITGAVLAKDVLGIGPVEEGGTPPDRKPYVIPRWRENQ